MLASIYTAAWMFAFMAPAFAEEPAMVARAPQAEPTSAILGTASGGALDAQATRPPQAGPKAAFAGGPDLTINVVNSFGTPLSIFYGSNAGAPTPVGNPGSGVLASSTRVLFPSNWAGRITIGKNYDPQGSKIEASFSPPNYVPDVDISYVDGESFSQLKSDIFLAKTLRLLCSHLVLLLRRCSERLQYPYAPASSSSKFSLSAH